MLLVRAWGWLCAPPRALALTYDCFAPQRCLPQSATGTGPRAPGEPLSTDRTVSVFASMAMEFHGVGRWQLFDTIVIMGACLSPCLIPSLFQGHKQQ